MSEQPTTPENQNTTNEATPKKVEPSKDSLGIDVKKSPWTMFALLQIPVVLIMVLILYLMSQFSNN